MSEASPTMNNSVEQYGVEMEFGTELKQAVSDEDGTRIVTYKPFIKDGEVTIYPVNAVSYTHLTLPTSDLV